MCIQCVYMDKAAHSRFECAYCYERLRQLQTLRLPAGRGHHSKSAGADPLPAPTGDPGTGLTNCQSESQFDTLAATLTGNNSRLC